MSKRKNSLKWVQLSPIWMKRCQIFPKNKISMWYQPYGLKSTNKGVNEEKTNPSKNIFFIKFSLNLELTFQPLVYVISENVIFLKAGWIEGLNRTVHRHILIPKISNEKKTLQMSVFSSSKIRPHVRRQELAHVSWLPAN